MRIDGSLFAAPESKTKSEPSAARPASLGKNSQFAAARERN
jgi:hypothetical protein